MEGGEGGESPEREPEGLEELRNRIRKQYPEAQPQARSEAKAWEDGRLDVKEASGEKGLENELEVLRKEIIEKFHRLKITHRRVKRIRRSGRMWMALAKTR
jgi:hypothetical protein